MSNLVEAYIVSDIVAERPLLDPTVKDGIFELWKMLLADYESSVEYQPEFPETLARFEEVPRVDIGINGFIGVHQPSFHRDITSESPVIRAEAFRDALQGLKLAHHLGALYYVVHPVTRDNWHARSQQGYDALQWIVELYKLKTRYGYTPQICIENLEFPKSPATIEEILGMLHFFKAQNMNDIGLVFDVAHHWHNYIHLLHQLPNFILTESDEYPELLAMHLSRIYSQFPESLTAYHFSQAYIDSVNGTHITHGLPGYIEGQNPHSALDQNRVSSLRWLDTSAVLTEIKKISQKHEVTVTRIVLEVHHRNSDEIKTVAQGLLGLWNSHD